MCRVFRYVTLYSNWSQMASLCRRIAEDSKSYRRSQQAGYCEYSEGQSPAAGRRNRPPRETIFPVLWRRNVASTSLLHVTAIRRVTETHPSREKRPPSRITVCPYIPSLCFHANSDSPRCIEDGLLSLLQVMQPATQQGRRQILSLSVVASIHSLK